MAKTQNMWGITGMLKETHLNLLLNKEKRFWANLDLLK